MDPPNTHTPPDFKFLASTNGRYDALVKPQLEIEAIPKTRNKW